MLSVLFLNKFEIVLFVIAVVLLLIFYKCGGYKWKASILWLLVLIPVLYFSINMVSETVTFDEPQYEECITDIHNLKDYPAASKVLYEYKFTQLTLGTVFWFIPKSIQNILGANNVWKIYKCFHWMLMYVMSLLTAIVWRKYILTSSNDIRRKRLGENAVLVTLVGLPLTCLLMKVTNYDAGSTYPAILGISLMWAAYLQKNKRMAFWATIVTALGVLDKWTALPYWIIAVVLFTYLTINEEENTVIAVCKVLKDTFIAYVGALAMSVLYFLYAGILQGGFCSKIDLGVIVFSFVHAIQAIVISDLSVYSSLGDVLYIPVLYLIMAIVTLVIYILCKVIRKLRVEPTNVFFKLDALIIIIGIIGGVIGAYFIPLRIAPFLQIDEGYYKSTDSFGGWIYHFGAKTAVGHFAAKVCYEWATILTNYPTVILVLLCGAAILILIRHYDEKSFFCSLVLSASLALLLFYAMAGLPSEARYLSYPILVIALNSIYLWYEDGFNISKILIGVAYCLYIVEMIIFIPNVKAFSPIWLWHSEEYNETVRTGVWYAGEVMFWGEHVAIAGNIIQDMEGKDNAERVIVFSDYPLNPLWPENPGYEITFLGNMNIDELRFDENSYYVINKFEIFRGTTPDYIRDVKPIAQITYKDEIGAWIYRGDQLIGYEEQIVDSYW